MPIPASVRIVIEQPFPDGSFMLKAYWQPPDGTAERMVILRSDTSRLELAGDKVRVEQLLLYVYEAGRVDAALGF